jgi:hypothetical protein
MIEEEIANILTNDSKFMNFSKETMNKIILGENLNIK